MKAKKVLKAKEVLKRYAAGEKDFRDVNLRGQSFKSKNLSGADFSYADIRSTNFNDANLTGANLTGAKCGLQRRWAFFLLMISILASTLSGFCSILIIYIMSLLLNNNYCEEFYLGLSYLILLVIFLIIACHKGIIAGAFIGAFVVAVAFIGAFIGAFVEAVAGAVAVFGTIAGTISVAIAGLATVSVAGGIGIGITFIFAVIGAVTGIVTGAVSDATAVAGVGTVTRIVAVTLVFAVVFILFGFYIGSRALKGNDKDTWIRVFAVALAANGGTNFQGANLSDVNFVDATLKNTNFRNAILINSCFRQAKKLNLARPGNSYLKILKVQQWLIGIGKDKKFDHLNLRGINFQDKSLIDASFIGADLSEANLQDADLSRAKLVQTQLDNTDLTGATLTGAFIEDWGITSSTKLDGVKCEYVFMRLPPEKRPNWLALPVEEILDPNPRRKPDNWEENFEGNDFADFIKPIFDTLDLYHNQGVDPRAIAISWKQLAENNPDANLRFASMEVKGEKSLLLRLKTEPNADLSKLSAEYFELYNHLKSLAEAEYKKLLAEKDDRIQQLEIMVNTALKRPSFYAENYQGDTVMTGEKRDIKIAQGNYNEKIEGNYYDQKGNFGIGHMSGGEIKGNAKVAGIINEAEQKNLADAAQETQQLLEQLSQTYPTNTSKEKNIVVGEVVDRIEQNPHLKTKVINALKAGGIEAFKEAINHPLVNIFLATIEGWQ